MGASGAALAVGFVVLLPGSDVMLAEEGDRVQAAGSARVLVGRSVRGRRIVATRLGDPASSRKVLVVGTVHGNEPGGLAVTRALRRDWASRVPSVDLWVVDSFNPDGRRRGTRGNARGVDLNRNFPHRWRRGQRGTRYWGGPRPLSEPESRAIRRLVLRIRPEVTIWYHQPWSAVLACGRRGTALPRRYARLAGARVQCRGRGLPGTATSWQNARVGGRAFVVEFGTGQVGARVARRHARAAAIVARGR